MVEFAFLFPFVLILVLMLIEFGFLFYTFVTVNNTTSEAARWAGQREDTPDWVLGCALRTSAMALDGRADEASALLDRISRGRTELTFSGLGPLLASAEPGLVERLHAGLGLAGWSE